MNLPVCYAGLAPGEVGVYQINVTVPGGAPVGLGMPLTINQGSWIGDRADARHSVDRDLREERTYENPSNAVRVFGAPPAMAQKWEVGGGVGGGFYTSQDVTAPGGSASAKFRPAWPAAPGSATTARTGTGAANSATNMRWATWR